VPELRVRVPLTQKAAIHTLAKRNGKSYRPFLLELLTRAAVLGYQPEPVVDTRLPMADELLQSLREVAARCNLTLEQYAQCLLQDISEGRYRVEIED
jgi:hypothetical protein